MRWVRLVVVAAALVGAASCGDQDIGDEQRAKADQLQTELATVDLMVPDGVAVSLYDTDGGLVCEAAEGGEDVLATFAPLAHNRFPLRPMRADEDSVAFARAVVKTYCPDELDTFDEHVEALDVGERN